MKSFTINWRTTAAGAVTIGVGVASLLGVTAVGTQPVAPTPPS